MTKPGDRYLDLARKAVRDLRGKGMLPAPVEIQNRDLDLHMWHDRPQIQEVEQVDRPVDDYLYPIPTGQEEPYSIPPQQPVWVVSTFPPWNLQPFWSKQFELAFDPCCTPTWEQEHLVGRITAPDMHMMVIQAISYEMITGLNQYDVFEFVGRESGTEFLRVEDMMIDPLIATPARRHVFAGDDREMNIFYWLDRNKSAAFYVRPRGLVAMNGVSNHLPGDPLIPNAHFRLSIRGYYAPIREDLDGGPRTVDLGELNDMDMSPYPEISLRARAMT